MFGRVGPGRWSHKRDHHLEWTQMIKQPMPEQLTEKVWLVNHGSNLSSISDSVALYPMASAKRIIPIGHHFHYRV